MKPAADRRVYHTYRVYTQLHEALTAQADLEDRNICDVLQSAVGAYILVKLASGDPVSQETLTKLSALKALGQLSIAETT